MEDSVVSTVIGSVPLWFEIESESVESVVESEGIKSESVESVVESDCIEPESV